MTVTGTHHRPHFDGEHGVDGWIGDQGAFAVQVPAVTGLDAVATVTKLQLYDGLVTPRDQLRHLHTDSELT